MRIWITSLLLIFILLGCKNQQNVSVTSTESSITPNVLRSALEIKIVGGRSAAPGELPWQVALFYERGRMMSCECGGSIIAENWVLTAAHCVEGVDKNNIKVLSGTVLLSDGGVLSNVDTIIIEENYHLDNSGTPVNDIALIRLEEPLEFSLVQSSIELLSPNSSLKQGDPVIVSGWGDTKKNEQVDTLQLVQIDYISFETCQQAYGSRLNRNMVCAGLENGGKDACNGDSGGPLVTEFLDDEELAYRQIGVVSWGEGCAEPGKYGVYTNVISYIDWIDDKCNCL